MQRLKATVKTGKHVGPQKGQTFTIKMIFSFCCLFKNTPVCFGLMKLLLGNNGTQRSPDYSFVSNKVIYQLNEAFFYETALQTAVNSQIQTTASAIIAGTRDSSFNFIHTFPFFRGEKHTAPHWWKSRILLQYHSSKT